MKFFLIFLAVVLIVITAFLSWVISSRMDDSDNDY